MSTNPPRAISVPSCGCTDESATPETTHQHGYIADKKRYQDRLSRIEGQVRGIRRMVDEDKYCIDILTQISALNSALKSVSLALLDDHMRHCLREAAIHGGEEAEKKFEEVSQAIARFSKS
ncbi:copper-sensing transcriptional repressor CsoR [Corynebacterium kutscheri]|uniref:Copper-sensing transcriptional repressor CsoR n=1 Tax=Corynebacterium kutscheri TaxID=35755 RepID=A0A0F6R0R1_9CORY|nr:metal-sensitive transcriptional regulator [Corynebacterium kutscheri]AKE40603.1 hypothetical protein UL82_01890 [Corynebacterium kutscheri]VEH04869.1 copper-sensing transcriptional repressor CsoR [Corynebacterium kutscheri]VEH11000.1 copper-sensing transcriptional repressor CsoR [Corynebacterium kutscheri]VEH80520.1 copper-sensing transcriptional repressor CsoR [Corynebacterium kutscheri]